MKFFLCLVVCLIGAVLSAPALNKQKREILPGDPRYGTDYHHHHHHDHHENRAQSASNQYLAPALEAAQASASASNQYLAPALEAAQASASASNQYLAPALEAAQASASTNNAYLAPAATDSVSPVIADYELPIESVPRQAPVRHEARHHLPQQSIQNSIVQTAPQTSRSAGHLVPQQSIQNSIVQTAPQTSRSAGHLVPQQSIQNSIVQTAPQTSRSAGHLASKQSIQNSIVQTAPQVSGSAGHLVPEQSIQNNIVQSAPQASASDGHLTPQQSIQNNIFQSAPQTVKQSVQNTIFQSSSDTYKSGSQKSDDVETAASSDNKIEASDVSQIYNPDVSNLLLGPQGEASSHVFNAIKLNSLKNGHASQSYHWELKLINTPKQLLTHVELPQSVSLHLKSGDDQRESGKIDDNEPLASEQYQQMTLIGSNGGYVY